MKLLTIPGHTSTASHIVLQWSGLPFEVDVLDSEALRTPAYRAMNPAGVVPALLNHDFYLTQTMAIMAYADDLAPSTRLFGDGSIRQRAEALRWLAFLNADLHAAFGPLFAPALFLEGEDAIARLRPRALERIDRLFAQLDAQLVDRLWLAGARTCADAYLFVACLWCRMLGIDISSHARVCDLVRRLEGDVGVHAALSREGLL